MKLICKLPVVIVLFFCAVTLLAQSATLSADLRARVDALAQRALLDTGVPSASIAIVQNGEITYLHAYGDARLAPSTPAAPSMRYSIGSISKQFSAAAILLLAEDGKLSLDDPVSRFVPNLTRGIRRFEVHFPQKTLDVLERITPDGKIEQYQVAVE